MYEKKTSILYKIIKRCVKVFYPKMQVEGVENLPNEPYIWCAGEMMHLKDVPAYALPYFPG